MLTFCLHEKVWGTGRVQGAREVHRKSRRKDTVGSSDAHLSPSSNSTAHWSVIESSSRDSGEGVRVAKGEGGHEQWQFAPQISD